MPCGAGAGWVIEHLFDTLAGMAGRSQATAVSTAVQTATTVTELEHAGQLARPVTLAGQQVLAVPEPLRPLFPDGGLRRGSIVAVTRAPGATSLALAMVAPAARAGSWVAVAGLEGVGLAAAGEAGLPLERLAVVPRVPAGRWATVVAALLDAADVVITVPAGGSGGGGAADHRRLAARVRERGAVLVLLAAEVPVPADLRLVPGRGTWHGVGEGHGHLRARRMEVTASGRRAAARPRRVTVWLPAAGGGVAPVDEAPVVTIGPARGSAPVVGRAHAGRLVP